MKITREQITGAIKLVNAAQLKPRLDNIKKLLMAEADADADTVAKILTDMDSYPDWIAGKALDA